MKAFLMIAAIPASIALGLVIMYPLMLVIAAALVGYGLFSIVHRLRTGRWPKGRQARPQPEGLSERERLAFYAVKGNRSAQRLCDAFNGKL